jgi:cytochrome oxidase assembly protein ShyY1
MQTSEWPDRTESTEAKIDRIGVSVSLSVLFLALVILGIWQISTPSIEKCSALVTQSERLVCYENLRGESLKPPAKGGSPPVLNNSN